MAKQSFILTDPLLNRNEAIFLDNQSVTDAPAGFQITKKTLSTGLSQGVDVIDVSNGRFRFVVLPTRGMGIWKASLPSDDKDSLSLGWHSPVRGPVHPNFVPLTEPSGLGWLDGFDELLCRCGMVSNGAPDFAENGSLTYPLHGQIANRPAHFVSVEIDGDEIAIKGIVEETRFHFAKLRLLTTIKTKFNEFGFRIHDEVENISSSEAEMQMLYHVNFGDPLLEAGAEVVLPAETVVPRNDWAAAGIGHWSTYSEPKAGMEERVYLFKLLADANNKSQVLLRNSQGSQGVSLEFDVKQLPCFTVWKNETSLSDGYVTGLEPGINFPNPRSFEGEQGRVVKIKPNSMYAMDMSLHFHESLDSVKQAAHAIGKLQAQKTPKLYNSPQPGWCA